MLHGPTGPRPALASLYPDGNVLITCAGTEMGQGLFTKVKQVRLPAYVLTQSAWLLHHIKLLSQTCNCQSCLLGQCCGCVYTTKMLCLISICQAFRGLSVQTAGRYNSGEFAVLANAVFGHVRIWRK